VELGFMFSRFSPAARAVVTLAEQECRNASQYFLGSEHLLLAMAIAPPPDVARYFADAGIEPWQVKRAVREAMDPVSDHPWEGVIVTPRVQHICALALERASAAVEPLDLLEAIVADGGGVAARVLERLRAAAPASRHG
jgi:ATP-dependent Clp protease ATP-binding subunit ClpA